MTEVGFLMNAEIGTKVPGLDAEGKVPVEHLPPASNLGCDLAGEASRQVNAHRIEDDAHTPFQVGAEPQGTANALMILHIENNSPHGQYALESQRLADIEAISIFIEEVAASCEPRGAASTALLAHKSEKIAHTSAQVGADPAGTAQALVKIHTGEVNPHNQYALEVNRVADLATITANINSVAANSEPKGTAASLLRSTTWINATLVNAWTNATGYATAQYRKLPGGWVEVKGVVNKNNNPSNDETVFTLPVGYRPLEVRSFSSINIQGSSLKSVELRIKPTGAVTLGIGEKGLTSLETIRFIAEQ